MRTADDPVHVQPERTSDRDAVERIHREAYGEGREARLVHELRATPAYIRELSLVAHLDERPVGHLMFTRVEIDRGAGADPVPALALAPLGVHPDFQDRGIGRRLVETGLDRARSMGHRIAVALGDPAYLSAFGFLPAGRAGLAPPFEVFGSAWMARALVPGALEGVSGRLSLPPPFDYIMGR